ncbi:MAG: cysteine desulfurase [Alphaproteobacteria bacterium]|nr:MAG: cysteine desulfurase [Alphaproteobacteria bacterium]
MRDVVYIDYNATSPLRPAVREAMAAAMTVPGNASSIHAFGRKARQKVESARLEIAEFIGANANQIIFTSGGTEANNTAIQCTGRKRVLVSAIEHDSVRLVNKNAEIIPVDHNGTVRLDLLEQMLVANSEPALVSVMLANNETGVIQPVKQIAEIAKKYGALVHTDAVQALGKMPINFAQLGVDLMTIAAHKSGGPQGIGALVFTDAVPLMALIRGGGQERSRRSGTENIVAIAGFGALIGELKQRMATEILVMRRLQQQLESAIVKNSTVKIAGMDAHRLPNTTCLIWPAMKSDMQLMRLDMAGVAVSAGSACSSGKIKPSQVLQAMGYGADVADCALRVSTGWNSDAHDIEDFLVNYLSLDQNYSKSNLKAG